MMFSAEFINERNPYFPVVLKFFEFEWVNYVTQVASDHGIYKRLCFYKL